MKLRQRFLTQNILILISTVFVTGCFVFAYIQFYNILDNSHITKGIGQTANIIIENDIIIHHSNEFSKLEIKEIIMNFSFNNNYYEHKSNKYRINTEEFIAQNGNNYRIITLSQIVDIGDCYRKLIIFIFIIFFISFIIANLIVQRKNMKELIIPITNLTVEMEKLKIGELDTSITDTGYDEIRKLATAIEEMRLQLKNSIYYREKLDNNRKFLISSISHDLKTPVTSIRGYIDGVLDGIADTYEKKQYYLSKAIEKTKLINTMVEDLLLYSKLDLNQMPFEKTRVNIIKYLEDCIEDNVMNFTHENKKIIFENQLLTEFFVLMDTRKFKRVIQNIIDNAKRNIEVEMGQLRIILREISSFIIIEFQDNGKGINENDLPYIFDRFYRADTARTVAGSSGLGLAITKQIVEGHGGRIWATSEVGQGTSIIISLKKAVNKEVIK